MKTLINVKDAAARMEISFQLLEKAMRDDVKNKTDTFHFGRAVEGEKSWRYIIVRTRFEAYMSAKDMLPVRMV